MKPRSVFAFVLLAAAIPAAAQTIVFKDTFSNGVAADSEAIPGFWTLSQPAHTTIAETNGALVITAGGAASPNGTLSPHVRSGNPSQAFNFFNQQLRFAADIALTGTAPTNQCLMRFALTGSNQSSFDAEDVFAVRLRGDNLVTISRKQDRASIAVETVMTLTNSNVGSTPTGFTLTLDATNYTLVVTHSGGNASTTFSGAHGLVAAQWGVDGASALQIEVVRSTGASAGAGQDTAGTVDNFIVTRLSPPPALFEDAFSNGVPADSDHTTSFWTASLPQTSSVIETGKLVQTASSASTGNIRASHCSPLSPSFNFFDQQLKISAELSVTGNTASTWMSRGQLLLASFATNGAAAPDTLMVGFRAQNNIAFNRKLDSPGTQPDANNSAAVAKLLGSAEGGNEAVNVSGSDLLNRLDLVLNATRYRLRGFNGGKGSGIIRFSGTHGIPRAQWGANGNSALLLETFRTGAAAGTSAVSFWDNVRVESDATSLLAEPYWDFKATYPGATTNYDYTVWLPSTEPVVRGVIFIGPGSGEDFRYMVHDPVAQEAARAIGFALIGYQNAGNMNLWSNDPSQIKPAVQAVLNAAAGATGHPELSNVPLCITGLSAGAFDSSYLVRNWPERVIAFVCHRGNDFSNPTLSASAKKVPGLMVAGSTDANSLTEPFIMQTRFLSWRAQGAQVAFAVDWGVGHTPRGNQGWEATFAWFVEVANLRYPRPTAPSLVLGAGSPALIELANDSGWLGDRPQYSAAYTPSVAHPFTTIAPYAGYSGVVSNASWLPNETCARIYRALTSTDATNVTRTVAPLQCPLRITSPAQYRDPILIGQPVTIELDPREFDNTNALVSVEFRDGSTLLGTDTTGPDWSLSFTPTVAGLHTLEVVATDTLGTQRAAFRTINLVAANYPPGARPLFFTVAGDASTNLALAAVDPELDPVTFILNTVPANGLVTGLNSTTGSFTYTPAYGFAGLDTFTYTAADVNSNSPPTTVTINVIALPDTDADGLPDAWEMANFGNLTPTTNEDPDGDGLTNLQEYRAGTNPKSATSLFHVTDAAPSGNDFVIRFPSVSGKLYRIERCNDLADPGCWTDIIADNIPGTGGEILVTDWGGALAPRHFYRVRLRP